MSDILVTGSRGFIGRALCARLKKEGYSVHEHNSSFGDIRDKNTFDPFEKHSVDHVFHLAARTFVPDSWNNIDEFIDVSVKGTVNTLEFAKRQGARFTLASAYVYGVPQNLPIRESDPVNPNNPYAISKYLAEEVCSFYSRHNGVPSSVLRIFNVYGPQQPTHFLLPLIIQQAFNEEEISLRDLSPKRDYVFIDDVISAMMLTLENKEEFTRVNIASGVSYSVLEIAEKVNQILGLSKNIRSTEEVRQNEIPDTQADISLAYEKLNWQPEFDIETGLRQMIDHHKNTN